MIFILASTLSPTLWVGTNGGTIIALTLTLPESPEKREEIGGVQCQLAKEVHLRHRAPVLALTVVDGQGFPLDNPRAVATTATAAAPAPAAGSTTEAPAAPTPVTSPTSTHDHGHRLIVCSEEQIKVSRFFLFRRTRNNWNKSLFPFRLSTCTC